VKSSQNLIDLFIEELSRDLMHKTSRGMSHKPMTVSTTINCHPKVLSALYPLVKRGGWVNLLIVF